MRHDVPSVSRKRGSRDRDPAPELARAEEVAEAEDIAIEGGGAFDVVDGTAIWPGRMVPTALTSAIIEIYLLARGVETVHQEKGPGSLCGDPGLRELKCFAPLSRDYLIRTMTSAYSVSDSISATPMMKAIRTAPPAPGLRAVPSQAAAVASP